MYGSRVKLIQKAAPKDSYLYTAVESQVGSSGKLMLFHSIDNIFDMTVAKMNIFYSSVLSSVQ